MRGSLVRRLLAVCAVTVMVLAAVAWAQNGAPVMDPAAALAMLNKSAGLHSSISGATVVVDGVNVRAVTLLPADAPGQNKSLVLLTATDTPNRVLELSNSGVINTGGASPGFAGFTALGGAGQAGFLGDGGDAVSAQLDLDTSAFSRRSGIAVAPDGTVYIADTKNSTIRAIAGTASSEPGIIRSVAGRWATRQNVSLVEPMGVAVDRAGNLYIADHTAGTVSVLTKTTGQLTILAHVASPAAIAVTLDGSTVFVASPDTGAVFAIHTGTQAIAIVPGFAPRAVSDAANSGPCAALDNSAAAFTAASASTPAGATPAGALIASRELCPAGIAVDGRGNLFIANANVGKILRVDANTNRTTTAASNLSAPGDIVFNPKGDLFVSEQGGRRILVFPELGDPPSSITITAPAPPAGPGCAQGATFTFCNEPTAGMSPSFSFTLTNTSATAATGIVITPPFIPLATNPPPAPTNFTTTSTSCATSLGPGASCVINVAFTPLNVGAITGTLTVTDSNPSDLATQDLAGTGDDFNLQIVPGGTPEVTAAQGGTATFMAQLNSVGVFGASGETVTLQCPINLPIFTTCAFKPCPIVPTVAGSTMFSIVIVTSTNTVPAPPVTNPCNSPAAAVRHTAGGAAPMARAIRERFGQVPLLPALLAILAIAALGLGSLRVLPAAKRRPVGVAFAVLLICGAFMPGCGSKSTAPSTATPIGSTTMNITANALDSNGNSLNAGRGLQIVLDVVK